MYPTITCLCPTRGRPRLLENAIQCFIDQSYPVQYRRLIIFDDLGNIPPMVDPDRNITILSRTQRYDSLPEKYNAMLKFAGQSDIYCVWEDDDIYFPWYLMTHAMVCRTRGWSKSSVVWSDYGENNDNLHLERTDGRFHASLAITERVMKLIDGWPNTKAGNFDQIMIANLMNISKPGCPVLLNEMSPGYVFCWHTGHSHGQSQMKTPEDTGWYDRYIPDNTTYQSDFAPKYTDKTKALLARGYGNSACWQRSYRFIQEAGPDLTTRYV